MKLIKDLKKCKGRRKEYRIKPFRKSKKTSKNRRNKQSENLCKRTIWKRF